MMIMALVAGCVSAPAGRSTLPVWFSEMPREDAIWGIGIARLEDDSLAFETATTRAQRDAARQISALVRGELIDYAAQSGLASNPRSMMAIENIGTNLVNMNLSSATVNARERMPDGTWYVRVSVRKADVNRQVNSVVNNEMANFAEFRADQALRRLEHSINNSSMRPQGLAE
jgi:hypothetical protein